MPLERRMPAGTLAELAEYHLDPKRQSSCAPFVQGVQVGCRHFETCPFVKHKAISGPVNVTYRLFKPEGRTRESYAACFEYLDITKQFNLVENGYVSEVIGFEGTTFRARGTKPGTDPLAMHEPFNEDQVTPPFARLSEREETLAQREAKRILADRKEKKRERVLETTLAGGTARDAARAAAAVDLEFADEPEEAEPAQP